MPFRLTHPAFRPVDCATLEAAQDAYVHRRIESGLGASRFAFGKVTDTTTGQQLSISYNGAAWNGDERILPPLGY